MTQMSNAVGESSSQAYENLQGNLNVSAVANISHTMPPFALVLAVGHY
jgi:hypothetical protein